MVTRSQAKPHSSIPEYLYLQRFPNRYFIHLSSANNGQPGDHSIPMPITTTTLDIAAAALGLFILQQYLSSGSSNRLPPGPKGLPLIGVRHKINLFADTPCSSN
jgi:hypothetical protein